MNIKIRVTAAVLFVFVLIFLYWFAEQPVAVGLIPPPFDKLVHVLMGAGITFLLWFVFAGKGWGFIGILVMLLAAMEEWHQTYLPGRVPDFYDFLVASVAAWMCLLFLHFIGFLKNKV